MKREDQGRVTGLIARCVWGGAAMALVIGVVAGGARAQGVPAGSGDQAGLRPAIVTPELPGWCKTPVPWPHRDRWPGKVLPLPVLPDPVIDPVPDRLDREPLPLERPVPVQPDRSEDVAPLPYYGPSFLSSTCPR
jgi:hypothetical protein